MKSAYLVLGVPGNASREDIEAAFEKAKSFYSPAKLAEDPKAVDKFLEVKTAHQILRDEESRAAHDRKLSSAQANAVPAARTARVPSAKPEVPWPVRALPILLALVLVVFATGYYISYKREAARKAQAELELQLKAKAAEEEKKEADRLAAEEANRQQLARRAEQQERQFRQESERAINNARYSEAQRSYREIQRDSIDQREAQRKDYEARAREQSEARAAEQRLARDKARIRELCYQNYRRPDC
ncbi:J domain-containing protein [Polaromonas sp. JS666]|uniref:J domain-containing protein n=1 Tax=Polaromonas sp. (strain JS666 / ATCC BAA-500) TaxID=296591 RepID=UPI00088F45A7|nr:DnaJ domain-containing protein [Polaromonas sp. JS666]SDN21405.1 DnaJ domain-containing protein [Polaromonas sp. JS666]